MAKRDPEKTRRNKEINMITENLSDILPTVLSTTGLLSEQSLNAKIGSKYADFIDIKNEVINSPEHFVSLWMDGMISYLENMDQDKREISNYYDLHTMIKDNEDMLDYTLLFLKRTYLRNFQALSKVRPKVEEAEMWIGQKNATYGILITPRFKNGNWENDKSEIRHFKKDYWTIGHILETGLVIPFEEEKIEFYDIEQYLSFFKNTMVRASGSKHEKAIAKKYCEFVLSSDEPEKVPLLIPEFRYGGLEKNHKYRLDFTIINPYTMEKHGFELSPWSTHGQMTGLKGKTQNEINKIAKENFEKEMKKHKEYYRKHNIFTLIYTDSDLSNPDDLFNEMEKYLCPKKIYKQLLIHSIDRFMSYE